MMKTILDLLQSNDWINSGSEEIEIAKGRNELPLTWGGLSAKIRRIWQSKK